MTTCCHQRLLDLALFQAHESIEDKRCVKEQWLRAVELSEKWHDHTPEERVSYRAARNQDFPDLNYRGDEEYEARNVDAYHAELQELLRLATSDLEYAVELRRVYPESFWNARGSWQTKN
jgi:hypothetical protein